jgi:hypothetical protein
VYVPAFDAWRAERLSQLAVHLTRARPSYAVQELPGPSRPAVRLGGVTLGRRDAERLAWVVLGSLASVDASVFARFLERGSVETRAADLLWLPFHPSGLYLREPVTGALVRGPVGADHRTPRAVEAPPAAPARRRAA